MVGVSASVNFPLHHKVQKFSSGTGSSGWSRKKGRKTDVVCCGGGDAICVTQPTMQSTEEYTKKYNNKKRKSVTKTNKLLQ